MLKLEAGRGAYVFTFQPNKVVEPGRETVRGICATQDGQKVDVLLSQFATEWDDAGKLASSTPRIQLSQPVAHLQQIRRNVEAQTWPSCALNTKALLIASMNATIVGYLST